MNWTDLVENLCQMCALFSVGIVVYGGYLYNTAPENDKGKTLGPNQPKTLGWRE